MVQGYLKVNKRFLRSIAVAFDECYLSACLAVPQLIWIGLNTVMVCVAALLVAYIAVSHNSHTFMHVLVEILYVRRRPLKS